MREKIYVYSISNSLPKNGWIQKCNNCNTYTSRLILFKEDLKYEFWVHLCPECQRKNINNSDKFIKLCQRKISSLDLKY